MQIAWVLELSFQHLKHINTQYSPLKFDEFSLFHCLSYCLVHSVRSRHCSLEVHYDNHHIVWFLSLRKASRCNECLPLQTWSWGREGKHLQGLPVSKWRFWEVNPRPHNSFSKTYFSFGLGIIFIKKYNRLAHSFQIRNALTLLHEYQ